jgi:hypothetical protein
MKKFLALLSVAMVPVLAGAQQNFSSVDAALVSVSGLIGRLIPFIIGVAVLIFI